MMMMMITMIMMAVVDNVFEISTFMYRLYWGGGIHTYIHIYRLEAVCEAWILPFISKE